MPAILGKVKTLKMLTNKVTCHVLLFIKNQVQTFDHFTCGIK